MSGSSECCAAKTRATFCEGPTWEPISNNAAELLRMHSVHEFRCGNLQSSIDHRDQKLRCFARGIAPKELLDATRQDIETFLDKRRTREGRVINSWTRYYWIANLHAFYKVGAQRGVDRSRPDRGDHPAQATSDTPPPDRD